MPTERDIQNRILVALSRCGATVFRQNTGMGWVGTVVHKGKYRLILEDYRPLHAGLCKGSSDIIGWRPLIITPEMVGQRVAVFVAVEVKSAAGRATQAQKNFIRVVKEDGGLADVARSIEQAVEIVEI